MKEVGSCTPVIPHPNSIHLHLKIKTRDHRKTVFMYLHKVRTTDDITSDCESGTACGPFIHMFHLLLIWSVPECDYCVHTAQTNHTKGENKSEFNLNRLNTAGVKTPLTLYCMNYDNLRQEC